MSAQDQERDPRTYEACVRRRAETPTLTTDRLKIPNERNYSDDSHSLFSYQHCCICGKKTNVGRAHWLILFRPSSGIAEYAIPDPSVLSSEELSHHVSIWIAPIGSDCLRRNPALRPYLIDRSAAAPTKVRYIAELEADARRLEAFIRQIFGPKYDKEIAAMREAAPEGEGK